MAMRDLIPWTRQSETVPSTFRPEANPIASFRREVDRLFDDMFRRPSLDFGQGMTNWPTIEVNETDQEVRVMAEIPGMDEKDIELTLDNGMLSVRGERKSEKKEGGYSERYYGRFERRIALPPYVNEDKAKADFHNGLLTVTLPKAPDAEKAHRIPINAETRH
jgi:HSP20 family protein